MIGVRCTRLGRIVGAWQKGLLVEFTTGTGRRGESVAAANALGGDAGEVLGD